MKKILYVFFLVFVLFSCSKDINQANQTEVKTWLISSGSTNITWSLDNNSWAVDAVVKDIFNNTWVIIKNQNNCIIDECIPSDAKISKDKNWNTIWNKIKNKWKDEEQKYTYNLNKDLSYFEIKLEEMMHSQTTKIFKIGDNYIKSIDDAWCGGSNLDQKVYNKDWKEYKDFAFDDIKKEIYIWNVKFNQTLVWTWWFWQPLDSYNVFKAYKSENWDYNVYENEDEFVKYITDMALNKDKKLYKSYIAQFKSHPWINVIFNSVWYDSSSIRVAYLWTDSTYLSTNLSANWDFMDLSVTNKIIWYYKEENNYNVFNKKSEKITKVSKSDLPFFKMIKLNDNWNYLVYLKDWYKIESIAEMCKPVVYYYGKDNEKNTLTLNLKEKDYFTKLIPQLDKNSSWNFEIKDSKIKVDNKKYDYLYYSLATVWYNHNMNWWIVKWSDIVSFFNDKLAKINFNEVEQKDFIDFWKNEYKQDKYYFISFKYKEDLDKIVALNFSKKPDVEFRVLLDSYELESYNEKLNWKYLYSKDDNSKFDDFLIKKFDRSWKGTKVFEWGWVLRNDEETIIK